MVEFDISAERSHVEETRLDSRSEEGHRLAACSFGRVTVRPSKTTWSPCSASSRARNSAGADAPRVGAARKNT
jgi:hypothetical protein